MRLLHLIHTPRLSGAEVLVSTLCKLHKAWGHECAIASFAPLSDDFESHASKLRSINVELFFPPVSRKKFWRIVGYREAILRFQPDVIFAHSELPSLYGRFATGIGSTQVPFVSVLHATTNFMGGIMRLAEQFSRFRINHVVSVSSIAVKNYQDLFGKQVPTLVIPNGIDIGRFSNVDRKAARARFGLGEEIRLALQVGRICGLKQQEVTLRVLRPWLESGQTSLWFVGLTEDLAYEEQLRNTVQAWGLSERVQFLGGRDDVPELLAAADLYFMPSKHEAQSIAMLEALASGVPIVASDIPAFDFARSLPGVALCRTEVESGYKEAISELLGSSRANRIVSGYSIERTASDYLRLGESLLKNG